MFLKKFIKKLFLTLEQKWFLLSLRKVCKTMYKNFRLLGYFLKKLSVPKNGEINMDGIGTTVLP